MKDDPSEIYALIGLMEKRFLYEALRYLGDQQEAEAACNYAIFRLWSKAKQFNEDRPALPYAISVLRNHCRDILRKRSKTIKTVSLDVIVNVGEEEDDRI